MLTISSGGVSYGAMRSKFGYPRGHNIVPGNGDCCNADRVVQSGMIALAAMLCFCASGCMSSLQKHTTALSTATAPVVDGAASAYQAANTIHEKRTDYDAIAEFDRTDPVYNPRILHPLLTEQSIEIRLAVLKAFQCYVETLVEITERAGVSGPR